MKGSGVVLVWRAGGWGASVSLHKTSSILQRICSFLWPKPHACPLQPGGRRKRNTVRNRGTDRLGDRLPSLPCCSSAKWKECSHDEHVSLFTPDRTRKRVRAGDGWRAVNYYSVSPSGKLIYVIKCCLYAAANLSFGEIGTLLK